MATLLQNGQQQFIDADGAPIVGGLVYFFIPNTDTPKDTWQDVGQTVTNANPVTLDAAGEAIIFGAGQYRQVVYRPDGTLVWDRLVQDLYTLVNIVWCGGAGGTGNAITLAPAQPVVALVAGLRVCFVAAAHNTGPATINVSGLGPVTLQKIGVAGPLALAGDELQAGNVVEAFLDLTGVFQIANNVDPPPGRSRVIWGGTAGGSANIITLTTDPVLTSIAPPTLILFMPTVTNTGAVTINADGLGPINLDKASGAGPVPLIGGELIPNYINMIAYDGTQYEIVSELLTPDASFNGIVNMFRNGTMDIWQRGIGGTIVAGAPSNSADGWTVSCTTANVTWAQVAGRLLTRFALQVTGALTVSATSIYQRIESYIAARCASQTAVVLQAWIYNGTGASITPTLTVRHANATDNWGASTIDVNAVSLQPCPDAMWTQVAYAFAGPAASANGLQIEFGFAGLLNTGVKLVKVAEVDLQVANNAIIGLVSSLPAIELRPFPFEQSFCERYFIGYSAASANSPITGTDLVNFSTDPCTGMTTAAQSATLIPKTRLRTAPTGITISNAGHFNAQPTFSAASPDAVYMTLPAVGPTPGVTLASPLKFSSTSGTLWVTGAEL